MHTNAANTPGSENSRNVKKTKFDVYNYPRVQKRIETNKTNLLASQLEASIVVLCMFKYSKDKIGKVNKC